MKRRLLTLALACPLSLGAAGVAHAQLPRAAQALKVEADKAFKAGDYASALKLLRGAYQKSGHNAETRDSSLIANMGLVLMRMKRYGPAVKLFERYLDMGPDAQRAARAESQLRKLKPMVVITSEPAGAEVTDEGTALGETPVRTEMLVGHHDLVLHKAGYETSTVTVEVALDSGATVHHALERLAKKVSKVAPRKRKAKPSAPPPVDHTLTYAALGAGGVSVAAAGVLYLMASSEVTARDEATDRGAWDDHQSSAETYNTGMLVGAGLGAAALGAGLYMLWSEPDDAAVSVTPSLGGLSVFGRF